MSERSDLDRLLGTRVSRRRLLAGALGLTGSVAISGVVGGQPPPPKDTTKVPGETAGEVGIRSPFEEHSRLFTGGQSWPAPLQEFDGIITPSDLFFTVSHAGVPQVDPTTYRLLIHGMVERPKVFTLDDLNVGGYPQ
jgi:sulfane dehydrogenase subunit SoxC